MKKKPIKKAPLVKALMRSTGLSDACVYIHLNAGTFPKNAKAAMAWTRTLSSFLSHK